MGLIFVLLLVCLGQCQPSCNHLEAFACGFNKRTYRSNRDVTTLSFASTVEYQLLRLDYELFVVGKSNCTSLDGKSSIHCTTEKWNNLNTIMFEIRGISKYRDISLHSKYDQDFDRVSFHAFPHPERFYGDFLYTEADNFDICASSDEVELTWQVNGTLKEEVVIECWHHDMKVCSTPKFSPDDRNCSIREYDKHFEVKIVAKQGVAKMDNYVCTLNGGRGLSKAVYWQVPLKYRALGIESHFEGNDLLIVSLDEERQKKLTGSLTDHGLGEEEYLRHDKASLERIEDPHIRDSSGDENGPHCLWKEISKANNAIEMKGSCRMFSLSYTVKEEQFYEKGQEGEWEEEEEEEEDEGGGRAPVEVV
ncbi:hypothetical protein SprV_0501923300 [Sparganum proliferum]